MDSELALEFLRRNGFPEAELALKEDIDHRKVDKFRFPTNPTLPPVKVPGFVPGSGQDSGDDDEFKSLDSSTSVSAACSSDFMNPYGRSSATRACSDTSSEGLSQFGTAREYHEFDMQTDLWYGDKEDGPFMSPSFGGLDPFGCLSEDKFVMTSETGSLSRNPFSFNRLSDVSEENNLRLGYPFQSHRTSTESDNVVDGQVKECHPRNLKVYPEEGIKWDIGKFCLDDDEDAASDFKEDNLDELESEIVKQRLSGADCVVNKEKGKSTAQDLTGSRSTNEVGGDGAINKDSGYPSNVTDVQDNEDTTPGEIPYREAIEDDYEVFNLRIIHRKNRTGFEENKDFSIVLNTIIAGRYYVTEYLGSAAFSKVVQAHDIQTGEDVCLKIIKNNKDFFDQSLDEIKLLKYVNKHDPTDRHHILRLYDYFYYQDPTWVCIQVSDLPISESFAYLWSKLKFRVRSRLQEHLFIVSELLRANLYEFQKHNLESGTEPYFTMPRLQAIARQCLEALDYLHSLRIIHCDLKPENVLIKKYRRCEIKVIDLGSSCFETDKLCLYVQSRSYRAPEIILGLPYGPDIDIWSLGCIIAELYSGKVLFPNDSAVALLAGMIRLLGPIDTEMLLLGRETHKYFTKEYDFFYISKVTNTVEYINTEKSSLEDELQVYDSEFIDFLQSLLQTNPQRRPSAKQALLHPWLSLPY